MLRTHRLPLAVRNGLFMLVRTVTCQWRQNLRRRCRTMMIVYVMSILASAAVGKAAAASLNVKALSRHDITDVVNFISSRRGGCVTVAIGNRYQTKCGPQDLKYINANTINIDLQIIGVKPKDLDRLLTAQASLHPGKKPAGAEVVSPAALAGRPFAETGGNPANLEISSRPGAVTVGGEHPGSEQQPAHVEATPDKGMGSPPWFWAVILLVLTPVGLFYLLRYLKFRRKTKYGLSSGDHGLPEESSASAGKITSDDAGVGQTKYDHAWLKKYGFDYGDDERGAHVEAGPDEQAYDRQGFDEYGYDREGYNREGRDGWGYDREGYNSSGYDRYGYDKEGLDCKGYDKAGFDREGYDTSGFNRSGQNRRGSYRPGYGR